MATYEVPEQNLSWLKEKIEKLNKKAEKLGVAPITIREVSSRLMDIPARTKYDVPGGRLVSGQVLNMVTVEVVGEAPVLAGWKFVATIEHVQDNGESGAVIHAVPGETVPAQYRDTDGTWCDHCRTRRTRTDTFIVRKVTESDVGSMLGTTRQVGRQCLRDFLGHPKPEMYAEWAEELGLLDDLIRSIASEVEPGLLRNTLLFRTERFLAVVNAAIRVFGWVSGKAAREAEERGESLHRTRDVALNYMMGGTIGIEPMEKDLEFARKVIEWGRTDLVRMSQAQNDNDYLYNLRTVLRLDALSGRMLGIAASAISTYQREMNKQASAEERAARSKWIGEEGVRQGFKMTIMAVRPITYRDGSGGTIVEMADDGGNEVAWFTGSTNMRPGETWTFVATVKRHQEFRGIKQTAISRPNNFRNVSDGVAPAAAKPECQHKPVFDDPATGECARCGKRMAFEGA